MLSLANKTTKSNPNDLIARIYGILNSIAQPFKELSDKTITDQVIIVPELIEKIIAEKECEYANLPIVFKSNVSKYTNDISAVGSLDDFSRMLSNLINNAVEACPNKSGIITINCEYDDGKTVKITIEDNGQGMPEEMKSRILNNQRATSKDSTHGLGFNHTRETLAKSGGKLDIESKSGVGTKVILTLPYANKLPNTPQLIKRGSYIVQNAAPLLKNVDFVIVEDDKDNASILADYAFKNKKVDIFNAAKGFLTNYSKYPLDTAILVDCQFPEENVNGVEICKELHAKGFTNFYLYSGMEFDAGELPSYIKTILKADMEALDKFIENNS
ncbi:MAG: hypothetical protein RL017_274 [Pseudomonadota bacterium]|jgi:anti-sigma regulatory factor (Ser/Thr protein kinase)